MLSDGLMADALHDFKLYQLVCEKAQRPALTPVRCFTASELNEACLDFPIELRHFQWPLLWTQRGGDAFEGTSFAHTLNCPDVYIEVFCDFLVQ